MLEGAVTGVLPGLAPPAQLPAACGRETASLGSPWVGAFTEYNKSLRLSSPHVIPIPNALHSPGLVDGDLELPAGQLAAATGWRDASQLLFALVAYFLAGIFASPGRRRPFLPGPLSPPHPISHSSATVRTNRKGSKKTNKQTSKQKQLVQRY